MNRAKTHSTSSNRILNAKEVCAMLGIGKNTLYEWCAQGLIPHKRVGGRIDQTTGELHGGRILLSDYIILQWIENRDTEN